MAITIDGTTGVTTPSGAVMNGIASSTVVVSTSGTSIDFANIPSWVKRITVMFSGVSTNATGSSPVQIQLGTGATPTYAITGYLSYVGVFNNSNQTSTLASTSGLLVTAATGNTSNIYGSSVIVNLTGNTWAHSTSNAGLDGSSANSGRVGGGSIVLSSALTAVRITTVNGTDIFDAGSINILYE